MDVTGILTEQVGLSHFIYLRNLFSAVKNLYKIYKDTTKQMALLKRISHQNADIKLHRHNTQGSAYDCSAKSEF